MDSGDAPSIQRPTPLWDFQYSMLHTQLPRNAYPSTAFGIGFDNGKRITFSRKTTFTVTPEKGLQLNFQRSFQVDGEEDSSGGAATTQYFKVFRPTQNMNYRFSITYQELDWEFKQLDEILIFKIYKNLAEWAYLYPTPSMRYYKISVQSWRL